MALPATEDFTGTNATLPNPPWTQQQTGALVDRDGSGRGRASVTADANAFWNADTFANDQYAQHTLAVISAGSYHETFVRCSSTGATRNNYYVYTDGSNSGISKKVNGTGTDLSSGIGSFAAADVMRIEAEGTTVRAKKNGVQISSVTDSSLASGAGGIGFYDTAARGDDWESGNLSASTTPVEASVPASWEALGTATQSAAAPWESEANAVPVESSSAAPWEAASPVDSLGLAPWESSAPVATSEAATWESLQGIRTDEVARYEALAGVRVDTAAPWEAEGGDPPPSFTRRRRILSWLRS